MPAYLADPLYRHGDDDTLGVLLVNLGTPDAATTPAVRRYLAEFLWDPRIVELPRALWWLILNGVILRIRPARSARAYRQIWTDAGSPLLVHCQALSAAIETALRRRASGNIRVALGMSYGNPSIAAALRTLHECGSRRLVALPLYPQYSGTTTGSVFDAVTRELRRRRWVPEFRFVNHYHDDPAYIAALADSIRDYWAANGRGDKLMFSFHGVPRQVLLDGDPYHCHCRKTARLVSDRLGLSEDDWMLSLQSRVGRAEWLRPYTDETVEQLGAAGTGRLDVVCPGFSVDCLETLEEIAMQNAELFIASGGKALHYIPALNDREDHVALLTTLVVRHASGWPEFSAGYDAAALARARRQTRELAAAAGADA